MKTKRFLSIVMAVLMVITMLPSLVFAAAPSGELDGALKIKGSAAVGSTLSADFTKVKPEGMTGEYVSFQWSRKAGEELTEVGTGKSYDVTAEDAGSKIVLKITGIEDKGVSGSLTASTEAIAGEGAQAPQDTSDTPQEQQDEYVDIPEETQNDNTDVPEDTGNDSTDVPDDTDYTEEDDSLDPADLSFGEVTEEVYQEKEPQKSQEPLTYEAEVTGIEGDTLDFGKLDYGYTDDDLETKLVTIKNTGTGTLTFDETVPEFFMVQDISELAPGESVSVWVQPRTGLESNDYQELITYTAEEGVQVSFEASVHVEAEQEEPKIEEPEVQIPDDQEPNGDDPDMKPIDAPEGETASDIGTVFNEGTDDTTAVADSTTLLVNPSALVFSDLLEGYTEVIGQKVTITYNGETKVTLVQPQAVNFDVTANVAEGADAGNITLEKGGSVEFTIAPKANLAKNQYSDTIVFGLNEDTAIKAELLAEVKVVGKDEAPVKADPDTLNFEKAKEGYTEVPAAQTVTITNNSADKITLKQPEGTNFEIGTLSALEVEAGKTATFTVAPKLGLAAGEYKEIININPADTANPTQDAAAVQPLASVTAVFTVEKDEPVYKFTVDPEDVDFGSKEVGYSEAPKAQTVTITNEGNTEVQLTQPQSDFFDVGALSASTLKPGEKANFTLRPQKGLEESDYLEVIEIPNSAEVQVLVNAYFSVTDKSVRITGIQKTADITGLANGTKKTADALKLPGTVVIKTSNGKMKAKVTWDVNGSSYDPKSTDKQTFNVKGKITLPKGVKNPDDISLVTSVKVSVKGYTAKVPDASQNKITGISSDGGYTTESRITFTAVGAGMDNENPRAGDVRYVPLNWKVINTNSWSSGPYTVTFGMAQAGNYTLTVTFNRQKFDGSNWVNTGEQDTKQVNFTISVPKSGQSLTPAAKKSDANRRSAVQTGDTTNIAPFIIILVVAAACIIALVLYRKRKK
ncbi:LPXTG cell wall anchor domain-containing protein [Blautia schinkii]|nr:LPXTG cell wall anchor domain-containing protein [Blautia schinkii]